MKSNAAKCLLYGAGSVLLLLLIQTTAYADSVPPFTVDVNTTALEGGSYIAGFVLVDSSGVADAGNTLTINGFAYGGGSAGTVDSSFTTGGASGDLSSGITLTDTSDLNGIASSFTPGTNLSFLVTPTVDPSDLAGYEFVLVLFDSSGNEITTTDPSGNDFLADAQIVPGETSVTVDEFAIVTPEPSTLLLLCLGLAALGLGMMRKRSPRRFSFSRP